MEIGNHCSRVKFAYTKKSLREECRLWDRFRGIVSGLSLNRGLLGRATIKNIIVFRKVLHIRLRTFDRKE